MARRVAGPKRVGRPRDAETATVTYKAFGAFVATESAVPIGSDGRMVAIPEGARGVQGSDGRMVAIPSGWRGLEGADGRMVAVPPAVATRVGPAGRIQLVEP